MITIEREIQTAHGIRVGQSETQLTIITSLVLIIYRDDPNPESMMREGMPVKNFPAKQFDVGHLSSPDGRVCRSPFRYACTITSGPQV